MTNSMALMKEGQEQTKNAISIMQKTDITSRLPQNLVMGGLGVGGVLVVGSIATTIITGVVALAVSGGFLVAGGWGYHKIKANAPAIRKEMRDKAMAKLIEDTKENDIFHLQNAVIERTAKARTANESVAKILALVMTLESKLEKAKPDSPSAKKLVDNIARFKGIHEKVQLSYQKTLASNQLFEERVEQSREDRNIADLIGDVVKFLDINSGTDLNDILNTEAFDSIDMDFNSNLAQIETDLAQIEFS